MPINTVLRTHCRSTERVELLCRSIRSIVDKGGQDIGRIKLVDDSSPLRDEVRRACSAHGVEYHYVDPGKEGGPDVKRGLVESMRLELDHADPVLCVTDDLVLGKGFHAEIMYLANDFLPNFIEKQGTNLGMIVLFACYPRNESMRYQGQRVWRIPNSIMYAFVCAIYSDRLKRTIVSDWEKIQRKELAYPCKCEDLWVARDIMTRDAMVSFCTMQDYAQHTGMFKRTFGAKSEPSSNYSSEYFVGE